MSSLWWRRGNRIAGQNCNGRSWIRWTVDASDPQIIRGTLLQLRAFDVAAHHLASCPASTIFADFENQPHIQELRIQVRAQESLAAA